MPRFAMMSSPDQSPERVKVSAQTRIQLWLTSIQAHLIQSYMVLHSQQTSVRRRLSASSSSSSRSPSPEVSPTKGASAPSSPRHSPSLTPVTACYHNRRPSRQLAQRRPSVPCILERPDDEADEHKLDDLTRRIKSTLTDLLNCENVKHDSRMRLWVQARLMDAQHEMNDHKRSTINEGTAAQADAAHSALSGEEPRKLSV